MKEEFNELVELFKEDFSWICEECFEIAWCNKYTYKEGQREVKKLINRYFKYFNKQLNKDDNYQKAWSMLGKLFTVAYEQYEQKKRKKTNGEIVNLAKIKEHKINKGVFLALQKSGYSQSGLAQKLNLDRSYLSKMLNMYKGSYPMYIAQRIRKKFKDITPVDMDTTLVVQSDCNRVCFKLLKEFEQYGQEIPPVYVRNSNAQQLKRTYYENRK